MQLTGYYVVVVVVVFALIRAFPTIESSFTMERLAELASTDLRSGVGLEAAQPRNPLETGIEAITAIVGALVVLAPVAWVYMLTKQEKGYDESVVHTVLILPVPVTGLVIVVVNSLTLAFALAGIVAAVRFRNTLDDSKDAVYIFLAIGTALAAGAEALGIAFVTSVLFNYLVLFMWRRKIGNIYADAIKGRTPKMRLGDVLAGVGSTPGAGLGNLTIGDPSQLAALTPNTLSEIAERKARLHEHLQSAGKKKFNGLLVVLAKANEQCLDAIDGILKQFAERHKLAEVEPTANGNSALEYLIALPKDKTPSQFVSLLRTRAQEHVIAAEYRNLKLPKTKTERVPHWTLPK
jgi:hypothetical protein